MKRFTMSGYICFSDCALDMWTPYKQLCNTVEKCIIESNDACFGTLQATFQKYKQNFLNVLKNPVSFHFYFHSFVM